MVPASCFFSLGFGTLVYLGTEAKIRSVLHRFTLEQAAVLQAKSNLAIFPSKDIIPNDDEEVKRLTEWQDRILAGGRYGSRVGTAVSIALPLIMPVLSLIIELW